MRLTSEHDYPVAPARLAEVFADRDFSLACAQAAGAAEAQADVVLDPSGEFTSTLRCVYQAADLPAQLRAFLPGGLE
ncbi:MAG: DUF2505 family protein, partial [Bifidobacteriaceae bacterium]|nr:DUF2505 family protein [Bifidobacteriaceae bacterium]